MGHAVENYEWEGMKMPGRVIDLTPAGAKAIGSNGLTHVELTVLGKIAHRENRPDKG